MDKRLPGEKFEDYKERLKTQAKIIKQHLKGSLFWDSSKSGTWQKKDKNLP